MRPTFKFYPSKIQMLIYVCVGMSIQFVLWMKGRAEGQPFAKVIPIFLIALLVAIV